MSRTTTSTILVRRWPRTTRLAECSRSPRPAERAVGRGEPAQPAGDRGQLERLLRRLQRRRGRRRRAAAGRADLAGLLPVRRTAAPRSSPRWFRDTRGTPRRTELGRRCGRPAPATRSSPGTATAGCSPARRAPTTRPGSKKTFGDVWVATYENPAGVGGADDQRRQGVPPVGHRQPGSSAPNLLGVFNDKTSIAADRTSNPATRGNVYFAWSRFTGNGGSNIYVVRSTDHGATFSTAQAADHQRERHPGPRHRHPRRRKRHGHLGLVVQEEPATRSTTRSPPTAAPPGRRSRTLTTYISYDAQDVADPTAEAPTSGPDFEGSDGEAEAAGNARDCGVLEAACASGYIFFRRTTSPRSSADQTAPGNPWVYVVVDPVVPGSQVPTGTTYGATEVGVGGQSAVYAIRFNPLHRRQERHWSGSPRSRPGTSCSPTSSPTPASCTSCGGTAATTRATRPPARSATARPAALVAVAGRLRDHPGPTTLAPAGADHGSPTSPATQLGPVRRPHRAVRRRLPVDRLSRGRTSRPGPTTATRWPATTRGTTPDESAPTSCSAAPNVPTARSPATPARAPAGWTKTSTATSRHRSAIRRFPGRRSTFPSSHQRGTRAGVPRRVNPAPAASPRDQPIAGRQGPGGTREPAEWPSTPPPRPPRHA